MKLKDLKKGDKVVFYSHMGRLVAKVKSIKPDADGCVSVMPISTAHGASYFAHPKQLRRLKPPKPMRRIWLDETEVDTALDDSKYHNIRGCSSAGAHAATEFIEVRVKKVKS